MELIDVLIKRDVVSHYRNWY